jgi:sterol desaturase/sphingolipid hydroxylase (fatty acid hydroxylase superfamily)
MAHNKDLLHQLIGLVIAFGVLTVFYAVLARLWPSVPGQRMLRKGFWTDCAYWLWTPFATKIFVPLLIAVALAPFVLMLGLHYATIAQGHGLLARQPLWLQGVEIFVLGDFLGYWQHRLFHGRALWRFHAVHHSSSELDWLSSVRLHPVNDFGAKLIQAVPLVLLGFDLTAVALYGPATVFYAIMVHANLSWDFGPFRAVFASPTFHRWHHTKAEEGLDKNFAGAFPLWDILFGTYYMPRRQPTVFGIDEPMPDGLFAQLAAPFRKVQSAPAVATEAAMLSP